MTIVTKPNNQSPTPPVGVIRPATGPSLPLCVGMHPDGPAPASPREAAKALRTFVQELADDWKRDGSRGDCSGVAKAAHELLERLDGKPPVKRYVVALSHTHFVNWCRDQGVSPIDRNVVYIDRADRLRGIDGPKRGGSGELVILRGAGYHQEFADILDAARTAGF